MKREVTPDLLTKYFSGDCTEAEKQLVEKWLSKRSQNVKDAEHWLKVSPLNIPDQHLPDTEQDKVIAELLLSRTEVWETIHKEAKLDQPVEKTKRIGLGRFGSTSKKSPYYTISAVLIGIVVVAFTVHLYNRYLGTHEVETAYGEVREIVLPDSSVVHLNGNSRLEYNTAQQEKEREVWLWGEAHFKVIHKASRSKFLVHLSNQKTVEVLGTEFNVTDRAKGSRIVLQSGSIKLEISKNKQVLYLKPGELVETIEKDSIIQEVKTMQVDAASYTTWTTGLWRLDKTSLEEMLLKLKDIYGLTIQVEDSTLLKRQISGSIPLPQGQQDYKVLVTDIVDLFQLQSSQVNGVYHLKDRK